MKDGSEINYPDSSTTSIPDSLTKVIEYCRPFNVLILAVGRRVRLRSLGWDASADRFGSRRSPGVNL